MTNKMMNFVWLYSDTKWSWSSLLDGSWINCTQKLQQEIRCLDIWNCWFVNSFNFHLISFHNLMWYFCFDEFIHFNNWEICLFVCCLWNCCTMWTSQRQRCIWCCDSNSVNLMWKLNSQMFFWHEQSTYTVFIWIQRQRIDTRNSFKLSSETCGIDENVLEETTSTTSCILSLCVFLCFFVSSFHSQFNNLICFFLDWNVDRILKRFVKC
jgi:hypothetical protein